MATAIGSGRVGSSTAPRKVSSASDRPSDPSKGSRTLTYVDHELLR